MKFEGTSKAKNWMKNNRVREKYKFSEIYLAETYFSTKYFRMQDLEIKMNKVIR